MVFRLFAFTSFWNRMALVKKFDENKHVSLLCNKKVLCQKTKFFRKL